MSPSRNDQVAARYAFVTATVMIAQLVAAKAARDALFLSHFPATDLPAAMIGAGVFAVVGSAVMSWALLKSGPARLVPFVFALSAATLALDWAIIRQQPEVGAVILYLQLALFGPLLVSGFWAVVNERFDPHAAKATVARTAAFAALGGVVGGTLAQLVSGWFGVDSLLLFMAGAHMFCALGTRGIGEPDHEPDHEGDEAMHASGLRTLFKNPYLVSMAGLMLATSMIDALLDYALKSSAATMLETDQLINFFATFYTLTGLVAFGVQVIFGERVLRRWGLGGAMAVLPVAVAITGIGATLVSRLATVAVARAADTITSNSIFGAGFQLLYTPLPADQRRAAKPYIDVAARRMGDILGGAAILSLLFFVPKLPISVVTGGAVLCSGVALWLAASLHDGYIAQLAQSLRSGAVSMRATEALDATTMQTILHTQGMLDRKAVMAEIEALSRERSGEAVAEPASRADATVRVDAWGEAAEREAGARPVSPLVQAIVDLGSGDSARIQRALRNHPSEPLLVAHVIPLLDSEVDTDAARGFLRRNSTRCPGQLADALLDHRLPVAVRHRLPAILDRCDDVRAAQGLQAALEDEDFELRFQAAQALTRLIARHDRHRLASERVYALIERELDVGDGVWQRRPQTHATGRSLLFSGSELRGSNRALELVFLYLCLHHEMAVVGSALRSLHSQSPRLRGTALEYLETTLPKAVQRRLWPRLPLAPGRAPPAPAPEEPAREREAIKTELLESSEALVLPPELRRSR
jgi:AAA family ATP:ADP antiporter